MDGEASFAIGTPDPSFMLETPEPSFEPSFAIGTPDPLFMLETPEPPFEPSFAIGTPPDSDYESTNRPEASFVPETPPVSFVPDGPSVSFLPDAPSGHRKNHSAGTLLELRISDLLSDRIYDDLDNDVDGGVDGDVDGDVDDWSPPPGGMSIRSRTRSRSAPDLQQTLTNELTAACARVVAVD
jgi:hypothetical protein